MINWGELINWVKGGRVKKEIAMKLIEDVCLIKQKKNASFEFWLRSKPCCLCSELKKSTIFTQQINQNLKVSSLVIKYIGSRKSSLPCTHWINFHIENSSQLEIKTTASRIFYFLPSRIHLYSCDIHPTTVTNFMRQQLHDATCVHLQSLWWGEQSLTLRDFYFHNSSAIQIIAHRWSKNVSPDYVLLSDVVLCFFSPSFLHSFHSPW